MREHGLVARRAATRARGLGDPATARLAADLVLARRHHREALEALTEIVAVADQRIVLLKGVEVAQHYPEPAQRPFADLDLLVAEPERLVGDLRRLGYGFLPEPVPADHHHLPPMAPARGGIPVEVHRSLGWLRWMSPPSVPELLARAVPAATPVPGLWTLDPVDHALFVAVHAWADGPFRRLRDVVDVAVMRSATEEHDVQERAVAWRVDRLWRRSDDVVDSVLLGAPPSPGTRALTRHLERGRLRGPVAHRAAVYLADLLVAPPGRALTAAAAKLRASRTAQLLRGR